MKTSWLVFFPFHVLSRGTECGLPGFFPSVRGAAGPGPGRGGLPSPAAAGRTERAVGKKTRGEPEKPPSAFFPLWHKPGEYLWMSIIFVYFHIITA